ncbi:MAG: VOC family protein [Proteobacteria bacterium]|nr:MAG: VOC family protein [Pseudomonadota bacterium]
MQKITPFLWFDNNFEEAFNFYKAIFKSAKLIDKNPMGGTFELEGQTFFALNGGPMFKFTPAISLYIDCKDQDEVDYYWNKLKADGGAESQCGWLQDKFGLSWQVIPKALTNYLSNSDEAVSGRVVEAMMKMTKIEIDKLDKAAKG